MPTAVLNWWWEEYVTDQAEWAVEVLTQHMTEAELWLFYLSRTSDQKFRACAFMLDFMLRTRTDLRLDGNEFETICEALVAI